MVILGIHNYIALCLTHNCLCIVSQVSTFSGSDLFKQKGDGRLRKLVKRASVDDHVLNDISYQFSIPNQTELLCGDNVFKKGSYWYIYDTNGVPWKIIHKENYLKVPDTMYAQSENLKWYKIKHATNEFKKYFDSLSPQSMFNDTTYLCDNSRLHCKGNNWFVKDDEGDDRAIVLWFDNGFRDLNIYHVKCDNDRWYKFWSPPKQFVTFLSNVLLYKSQMICDKLVKKRNSSWCVPNSDLVYKKITHQNSRREYSSFMYAYGEDGVWYVFLKPSKAFNKYLDSLPRKFRYDRNDLLVKSSDGRQWMVPSEFNKALIELNVRQDKEDEEGFPVMHVRDAEGTWFMFLNPLEEFRSWCDQLPRIRRQNHINIYKYKLLPINNGTGWVVENYKGQMKKILVQGDHRIDVYFVRCDDLIWYRFEYPPYKFIEFISRLPVVNGTPISDNLLMEKNGSWYIVNKKDSRKGKLICQASPFSKDNGFKYGRDDFGCWHKFAKPPIEFLEYFNRLPYYVKISDGNYQIKYMNGSQEWMILGKRDGKLKKLVDREKVQQGLLQTIVCARSEEGVWYMFINPPRNILLWLMKLPESEKDPDIKFDNFRLVKQNNSDEWLVRDDEGHLQKIVLRSDKWFGFKERHIYFVKCNDLNWYKFIKPPKEFWQYVANLPANQLTPVCDDLIRKRGDKWYVINQFGSLKMLICRGRESGLKFTYVRDEDNVWYKFLHPRQDFKLFLDKLPYLDYNYDDERLSSEGDDWKVRSKHSGKPVKLLYRHFLVVPNRSLTFYMARDEIGLWYKFVNPPEKFKMWLYKLPSSRNKNILTSDNHRLVQIGTEWRVTDNNGALRQIIDRGDQLSSNKRLVCLHCDNKKWYKIEDPPKSLCEFISKLPVQQLVKLSDNSLTKSDEMWAVINKFGAKRKIIPNLYHFDRHLYQYARDEDGFWLKFKNPSEEFLNYMRQFPVTQKSYGKSALRAVGNNTWQLQSSKNGDWKNLTLKIRGLHELPGFVLREVSDGTGEWYAIINPSVQFKKFLKHLPTFGGKWFKFQWDNLRLSKKDSVWMVEDNAKKFRKIVMGSYTDCNNNITYRAFCDNLIWYRFKFPPEGFIKYFMKLNITKVPS